MSSRISQLRPEIGVDAQTLGPSNVKDETANDLPFADDEKLFRSIEVIQSAKAAADAIWALIDLAGFDAADRNRLDTAASISQDLALGVSNTLEECIADLRKIHHEWLKTLSARRDAVAGSRGDDAQDHAEGQDNVH